MIDVIAILGGYNVDKTMAARLEYELAQLRRDYAREERCQLDDLAGVKSPVLSDAPRGGGYRDKIADAVARVIDGDETQEMQSIRLQIEAAERRLELVAARIKLVDGWLDALPDREEFVIHKQVIDGVIWDDVIEEYHVRFGKYMSRNTLRAMKRLALSKLSGF